MVVDVGNLLRRNGDVAPNRARNRLEYVTSATTACSWKNYENRSRSTGSTVVRDGDSVGGGDVVALSGA